LIGGYLAPTTSFSSSSSALSHPGKHSIVKSRLGVQKYTTENLSGGYLRSKLEEMITYQSKRVIATLNIGSQASEIITIRVAFDGKVLKNRVERREMRMRLSLTHTAASLQHIKNKKQSGDYNVAITISSDRSFRRLILSHSIILRDN